MLELHIDNERFTIKPDDDTMKAVGNRITRYKGKYTVREFADLVGEQGYSFVPALMNGWRISENFIEQQVFSIDFDETLSLEEFWQRTKLVGLYPVFVYKTLRCGENNNRYRAVYVNDCIIKNSGGQHYWDNLHECSPSKSLIIRSQTLQGSAGFCYTVEYSLKEKERT